MYGSAISTPSSSSEQLIALLKRSIGEPASYSIVGSRGKFLALAQELGIETPETQEVNNADEVCTWCTANGFPAVLKADGTSGGQGVKVVDTMEQAMAAYRSLHLPVPSAMVLKRTFIDRDLNLLSPWLKRKRHTVTIQKFVSGTDFNIAVACWQGEVIATLGAEVLETWRKNGPASVIRMVPDGEMLRVARLVAGRLGLSGLFGLDFLVDKATGRHTLIEINPRATQTCHIPLGANHDLVSALCAAMTGETLEPISITEQEEIALFPLAWQSSQPHVSLQSAFHDIPWEEPNLVRAGEAETQLLSHAKWMQLCMRALQR
jgi:biotin carboxylase